MYTCKGRLALRKRRLGGHCRGLPWWLDGFRFRPGHKPFSNQALAFFVSLAWHVPLMPPWSVNYTTTSFQGLGCMGCCVLTPTSSMPNEVLIKR